MADVEMAEPAPAAAPAAPPAPTATIGGQEVLPWVEKYRPKDMESLLAHQDIINTIKRFVDQGTLPHLLLHGPPGTGKTSTIKACAKVMYGRAFASHCLELNASDERGINVVREQIRSFASAQQLFASKHPKLVILDEADHMTNQAQFALRRIIEDYHKNTRFCLIGNYANKIIPALQSRCTRFRFQPLSNEEVGGRVQEICREEKVELTPDGLEALCTVSRGDMRKVLNILQATAMAHGKVNINSVYLTTGTPLPDDLRHCFTTLMTEPFDAARKTLDKLRTEKGYSLADLLRGVFDEAVAVQLPKNVRPPLMQKLADIEHRLSRGASEKMQAAALVAAFVEARTMLGKAPVIS